MRGLGTTAMVWDGEVSGVHGGLMGVPADRKVLIPSDSRRQ